MRLSESFALPLKGVYLDSAASSLTLESVLEKMDGYYRGYRANIHRGAHRFTRKASEEYENVYEKLAKFFNAGAQDFINVRNTTEGLNGIALGLSWKEGDEIVTTDAEHHSNSLPWLSLKKRGVNVKILESEKDGSLDPEKLTGLLSKKTRLFSFTACSNVLGTTVPILELAKIAKDEGALVAVDAAQYVGHHAVDLKKWPIDFLAFSGHKTFGPTGVGVLYHRPDSGLMPWFVGGGTVRNVTLGDYALLEHRERFEAGTPAIAQWIGLGSALDFIGKTGYSSIEAYDNALAKELLSRMAEIPNLVVYGPSEIRKKSCALFSFNVKGIPHHQTALMLDQMGFAVRSGHHCAIPLTKKLGIDGTVRASFHFYNTFLDVEDFCKALLNISKLA